MKPILKSIYPYLYLFFCFILPLDKYATAVPNIVLIILIAIFPFVIKKEDFKKLYKKEILIFAGLVFYLFLNSVLFQDYHTDFTIIKKTASSLLLVILFIPLNNTINLKKTIIISVLFCVFISLINLYFFYTAEKVFNFASGGAIDEVLIIDRLYLGFLCVLSILASFGLIGEKYHDFNKWYFANIVLNILFILLISSRIAILLLLILFFIHIFYSKKKKQYLLFFIGIIITVIFSFSINKNLQERFFYTQSSKTNKGYVELFKSWEPRFVIWNCNYNIAKETDHFFKGLGFYMTKELLVECYKKKIVKEDKRNYFIKERFSSHNQFMDFLLSAGVFSLVLFATFFLLLFYGNRKSFFKTSLLISLASIAFIDCIFHRQLGAYLFSTVLVLIIFSSNHENKISKINNNEKN